MSKKAVGQSRKKAILSQRRVPQPDSTNLIWISNKEGNAYIRLGPSEVYEGDKEVEQLLLKKIIPEINKSTGKIWIKQQQNTFKSLIFPKVRIIIRSILIILGMSLVATLLTREYHENIESEILIMTIVSLWLGCIVIAAYTFSRKYERNQFDQNIVREVQQILIQSNAIYLKKRGYTAKCDQLALWISVSYEGHQVSSRGNTQGL